MNSKAKLIIRLFLVLGLILTLSGCSSSGNSSSESQASSTRTIDYSKESIDRNVDSIRADFDQLREKITNSTNDDAKALKEDLSQLRTNVEEFDRELTRAVTDNKLANDLKQSYDGFIETLKTDLNNLDKEIDEK